MKAFTNLEQSKKLAKILPIESVDMFFADGERPAIWNNKDAGLDDEDIPCWSLAALLGVVSEVSLNSFKDGNWNVMVKRNGKIIYSDTDNPVDAVVELIMKLHEQKLL